MKKIILIIIVIVVALFAFTRFKPKTNEVLPAQPSVDVQGDATSTVEQELQGLELGDLDKEFDAIDIDLNKL